MVTAISAQSHQGTFLLRLHNSPRICDPHDATFVTSSTLNQAIRGPRIPPIRVISVEIAMPHYEFFCRARRRLLDKIPPRRTARKATSFPAMRQQEHRAGLVALFRHDLEHERLNKEGEWRTTSFSFTCGAVGILRKAM